MSNINKFLIGPTSLKWTESTSTTEPYVEKAESVGYLKSSVFITCGTQVLK